MTISDEKFIVFKREQWDKWVAEVGQQFTEFLDASAAEAGYDGDPRGFPRSLDDAVVIRRQDYFAGPALHTYAAMIDIAVKLAAPGEKRNELKRVADYFHEQAIAADAEGYKVPD